jgi:hypothetical protein
MNNLSSAAGAFPSSSSHVTHLTLPLTSQPTQGWAILLHDMEYTAAKCNSRKSVSRLGGEEGNHKRRKINEKPNTKEQIKATPDQ